MNLNRAELDLYDALAAPFPPPPTAGTHTQRGNKANKRNPSTLALKKKKSNKAPTLGHIGAKTKAEDPVSCQWSLPLKAHTGPSTSRI